MAEDRSSYRKGGHGREEGTLKKFEAKLLTIQNRCISILGSSMTFLVYFGLVLFGSVITVIYWDKTVHIYGSYYHQRAYTFFLAP